MPLYIVNNGGKVLEGIPEDVRVGDVRAGDVRVNGLDVATLEAGK